MERSERCPSCGEVAKPSAIDLVRGEARFTCLLRPSVDGGDPRRGPRAGDEAARAPIQATVTAIALALMQSHAPAAAARCVAGHIVDQFSIAQLSSDDTGPFRTADYQRKLLGFIGECPAR